MMNTCKLQGPFWDSANCPGEFDASHICRACRLQQLSMKKVERLSYQEIDRGYQLYLFHSNILADLN